ncbi:predicted protein [Plenodomus lingam JN3]|uniref:Predicted protein n=1 Tax=Leptosphaeria maculans (strain JN3 / isolate v23.1.3 / race Av1-4-5-6-7-8) TaxID=985895 RepID=E5A406_LEPMJ|nr:predicted protein [Plenodomus lingam JN3]CBX98351.1 predicted protein [Plenodomus lingam JN3]
MDSKYGHDGWVISKQQGASNGPVKQHEQPSIFVVLFVAGLSVEDGIMYLQYVPTVVLTGHWTVQKAVGPGHYPHAPSKAKQSKAKQSKAKGADRAMAANELLRPGPGMGWKPDVPRPPACNVHHGTKTTWEPSTTLGISSDTLSHIVDSPGTRTHVVERRVCAVCTLQLEATTSVTAVCLLWCESTFCGKQVPNTTQVHPKKKKP